MTQGPFSLAVAHHELVRLLLALALALLVVPLASAEVSPRALVLGQTDVPAGFRLDRDESGSRTNETEAQKDIRLPGLFKRWGRVTGYETEYDRQDATLGSSADLFRSPKGARLMMAWFVKEARTLGARGIRRSAVQIGAGGWLYGGGMGTGAFNLVVWRHERVFAGVVVLGIGKTRTLALARVQQRRLAAALP